MSTGRGWVWGEGKAEVEQAKVCLSFRTRGSFAG